MSFNYPEGATPLDPDELQGLKFKHVTTRTELDHLEQANIQDGLSWLKKYKKTNLLNVEFIRLLHKRLFGAAWEWAGNYRKTEKNIGIDPAQISVQLHNLLNDVQYWIDHNTYPALEIALRFHHRLVYIHLFPNGNGRHARIMADVLLTKVLNQTAIDWAGGYNLDSMNIRRTHYIQALRAADAGNLKLLLAFACSIEK